MNTSLVQVLEPGMERGYTSAVSLHAHTWHSQETLGFLPEWMARTSVLRTLFGRELRRYRERHGYDLDFGRAFWRPPLMPAAVCESEADQIEGRLALRPIISLTDHDSIEAPMSLQGAAGCYRVPVSIEWTAPFRGAVFHLGIHNLPPESAPGMLQAFSEYSSRPVERRLRDLMSLLDAMPDVLTVLNHPYWNGDVNETHGRGAVAALLESCGRWIHALELNGYRRWSENQAVIGLARARDFPLIAGGDRHGHAPNALLNLSHAASFSEFVDEIRSQRCSHIVILPAYLDHSLREVDAVSDILEAHAALLPEYRHWSHRVFFTCKDGVVRPLAEAWEGGPPYWMMGLVQVLRLVTAAPARQVVRLALAGGTARMF